MLLRSLLVEPINTLITANRKRLRTKTALTDGSNTSIDHANRYLGCYIELLGQWSNILYNLLLYDISSEILRLVATPLEKRILEMVYEAFQTYNNDKQIEDWIVRIHTRKHNMSMMSSSAAVSDLLNLNSLDNIVQQLASMKVVLTQHWIYLYNMAEPFFAARLEREEQLREAMIYLQEIESSRSKLKENAVSGDKKRPGGNNANTGPSSLTLILEELNNSSSSSSGTSNTSPFLDHLLLIAAEDIHPWKALSMHYITLEAAYLEEAIYRALVPEGDSAVSVGDGNEAGDSISAASKSIDSHTSLLTLI